jgi:DNA-binding transcriptional ArsR family regulator
MRDSSTCPGRSPGAKRGSPRFDQHERGRIYKVLLEQRGVKRTRGPKFQDGNSATVAEIASDLGIPQRTFERHLAAADAYEQLDEPVPLSSL